MRILSLMSTIEQIETELQALSMIAGVRPSIAIRGEGIYRHVEVYVAARGNTAMFRVTPENYVGVIGTRDHLTAKISGRVRATTAAVRRERSAS